MTREAAHVCLRGEAPRLTAVPYVVAQPPVDLLTIAREQYENRLSEGCEDPRKHVEAYPTDQDVDHSWFADYEKVA